MMGQTKQENLAQQQLHSACMVQRVVPFVHVADVDASLGFYAMLGFVEERVLRDGSGGAFWGYVRSGAAEMMFARASGIVDAQQQAVLFYMYSKDVRALRSALLSFGLRDGGVYRGMKTDDDGPRMVYEVSEPAHMPRGEMRVVDGDGYVILIGEVAE